MITVALRFDDPSPTSNHALEERIISALDRHKMAATFAVIPFSNKDGRIIDLDERSARHLTEASRRNIIEIALHGHSHLDRRSVREGPPSEFVSVPPEEQAGMIHAGHDHLRHLFDTPLKGFVPPWNTFDSATTRILAAARFEYISCAWDTPPRSDIRVLPRTCHLSTLRKSIYQARAVAFLQPVVIAVMHHFDFRESGSDKANCDFSVFENLLAWLRRQRNIRIQTLGEIAHRLTQEEIEFGFSLHATVDNAHWRLKRFLPRHLLITKPWPKLLGGKFIHGHTR